MSQPATIAAHLNQLRQLEEQRRELAEALQAITDAYHAPKPWDLTEDELAKWEARLMGAIQRGGHILKKAGY